TFPNSGSTFNGKRVVYSDIGITMPDGAYPFELTLDTLSATIDNLQLNADTNARYTYTRDGWTYLLRDVELAESGLKFLAETSMPSKFGGKKLSFNNFILNTDGSLNTGITDDLENQAVYIRLAGWIFEGRLLSIDGANLNIGRAFIDMPKRMGDGSIQFRNMIIARDGTLVAQGSADKYDEFTAINGFNVNPTNAVISGDELYLTGYVYFPSGLGAGNYVNYTAAEILLSGDGFITTPEKSYPDESYSIGGLPVTANDYSFERDGLHIGRNTFQLGGDNGIIGVLLEDVVFYPDGSVSVGGETLEDPDPLPFFGWIFSLENIRLTDLGIAADAGVTLPPALKSRVINFEELTLYEDESGNLKFKTDVVIPRFDFDIIEDQLNVDFRYISLADGDLEIKETIITLPEAMDKKRIRIGKTTYSEDAGFDLGGISMDPFPLWGYTLYLDNLDIDNDQISFEGRVKLPDDFYFEELAGETFEIATLVYHYDTGVVDFDIQYAGKTFELEDGWAITATNLSLGSDGFGIGEGTLHFPEDWTAVDGRLSVDSVGFNGLEIQYSPFLADFESIEANNIKVDLDTYEFTINKIEYNTTDGFILAGTFPMDGVFQGDSPVLNVQRLQVTTDFQMGDLIASLDGLEQDLFTGLTYNGGVGVSYVDDIVKMNASGDFVFSEDFVLEELRGTAVLVNSFEFNLSAMELVTIDADWSDDTITLFEQTINYPAITIDYNTDGVDDGISIAGNLVFPADFPALGNEELILYVKSDFSGTLTDVAAGISITGPKKFIDDTWLRDFEVIAGLNETKNGLLLDLTGTVVLGDSFPDGLAGVSTTITSLVVDTFGGLKEFDAAINFPTLTLMDSFDIQNASIGFATAVGQDFLISLGGTIVLPDTFPEGLAGNAVNITDFSFSPTGGIYNVDISMSGINTALWDIIDLQNGSFSVTNNGNDELLFGFGGDLVLPEDLGEDLGGTIVNITDFVISTKTGIVSFNAGIATPIVFELFAGIDAAITKLNISETGISLAGNITFPDTFPEGLAGLTVGLDEFSMTWQGDITALSAGIPYVDITVAGFNAEATNISFGSNGLNIESLVLVMPENMNGTTVAVENAGIDTDGNFYGEVVIPFISIDMAGFTVRLDEPGLDLENQEISFSKASLIAPELIGGWSMEVNGVKINPSGIQFTGGKFSIPDFAIAGGLGFQGVFVDFMLDGQIYIIGGGGAVLVPGLGKMSAEVSFTNISSTYPIGLRYAKFEYTISAPGLPLGSTGINLHSIRGSIAFGPATEVPSQLRYMFDGSMRLSLGLTLTDSSGGYVVRGDMDVWVDVYDWEWAFKGNISVLNGVARGEAIAALGRSGFYTSLSVQIAFVRGSVEFYIFEYNNRTTVSGRGSVQLGIPAGIIWEGWIYFPKPWKPWYCQIPDSTIWGPSVGAEFGMFSKSGATVSGFKGYIPNVPGLGTVGVFMPSNGSPDMNFTSYTLYTPGRSRSLTADTGVGVLKGEIENGVYYSPEISEEPVMYSFNTGGGDELILSRSLSSESNPSSDMERLVFMVLHGDGEPEITAISPSGVYYSYGDSGTETIYSSWGMSFVVYNPEPGEWSVEVENMPDPDSYIIQVLGKQLIPELEVTSPSYSTETDGSVTINGTVSTPDGNPGDIEIYVSNDADSFTGKLAGTVTSAFDGIFTYELDTTNLAEGEYYVYASYRYLETPAVRIYADGSIRKSSEEALAAVTDIIAAGTPDGDMSLQFSNPNGERAKGYNVYYETMVDGVPEVRSYNIGNITKVALSGFTAETEGEFYVVPYNSRNETGPESEHIAVSFVTPASPEPVNDFTVDTNNIAVECPIGENVTSEITLTGVAPVVTGTASDYIGVDINDLPTGVMLVFDDYVKNISEGEAVFEYTVVCADNTGVGNYEFNLSFYNLTDSRTEETIDISLNTVMPEVKISELSETEIINTAEKQLFIYGDYFFDGTRLYLDGEELEVDDLSRYTITVTLPAGIDAGTRTLTVEGPGGNTATAALDVIEPYYLVKAYNTEITLSTGDEFSIPFSIMGMYGYEDSASFNLTEIPEGWNVSLSDSQINPGDNALINGYIPITESTGIFTIALSADSGAEVTYTINITDTAPTPTINGLSAASVFAGESFDIYGYGFGTNSTVTLSGEELTINSCKATIINVQLDEESESGVIVVNRDGVSSNEKNIYVKHKGFNIYSEEETLLMQAEETYSLELVIAGLSEEVQLSVETDNDDLGATLSKTTIVPNGVSELTIQSGSLIENGTYYVTVSGISEDIQKQKMITVTVGDAFTFETEELSSGIQDSEYYASIITANGEAPVTFSLTDGDLPTGLKLSDTGIISGTPVKAGTDNFTIESVDDYGRTIEQEFSITIEENVWFREGKDAGLSRYNPVPGPADSRKLWSLDGSSATAMLTDLISGDGFIYAWSSEKLSAFNAKSGNSLYSIEGEIHKAVYAAGSLYVLNGTNLEVYDAPYGTLKWIREGVTTFTTNAGSLITDEESGLCVLEMSGTLKNTIAGDLPETEIIWFNSMPHYTSGSDLIALTDTGWETVYTADSGSLLTGSVSGEYLYMAGDEQIIVLDTDYSTVITASTNTAVRATGITGSRLVILGDESLSSYDADSLEQVFTTEIAAARMALTREKIFLTGDAGTTALNAYTGDVIWNEETPAEDLISAGEYIYRLYKEGGLVCYNGPYNIE
ncbi:MAG TPA: hypothetical protein DCO79_11560, partial [Spirochaeta sp.]|nr:hypothetical protein [Spirochaeta sp.]